MARLSAYVHVADEDGQSHVFGPSDEVPAWAAKRITNKKAWDGSPYAEGGELPSGTVTVENGTGQDEQVIAEPPRGGAGSGKDAWAAYAAECGVDVPEDASRDDIIAALVESGHVSGE